MYCLPGKAWALGLSYPGTSSRVTYAPLVASSRRSCQTAAVHSNTESQRNRRFFSQGSLCLCGYTLGLLPRTPTLLSPEVTHRPWTAATGCRPEGNCRILRADAHKKKESTSMRLTPESGGYLLSRNSVPSAIASLTSLFGMGRGGTSLP